jgi:dihydrolipoamide dehydrogenase
MHGHRNPVDLLAAPHAVFSHPQIASVGLTQVQAEAHVSQGILVGRASYYDVAKGEAMMETDGFAKAIVDRETQKLLGFHIIGPYAPILIQEVVNALAAGGDMSPMFQGMHIHPAMPEVVLRAMANLGEPES